MEGLISFDFELRAERTSHTGRIRTFNPVTAGQPYSLSLPGLSIGGTVSRVRATYIGATGGTWKAIYEADIVINKPEFEEKVELTGLYTMSKISQETRIPLPGVQVQHKAFFLNFKGTKWQLIDFVADCYGRRWALSSTKDVVYKLFGLNIGYPQPVEGATRFIVTEGWFGSGQWNGVHYKRKERDYDFFWLTLKPDKTKARTVVEPPFKPPESSNFYSIVNAQITYKLPYEQTLEVSDVRLNSNMLLSGPGLTNEKKYNTAEWDWQADTINLGSVQIVKSITFKFRIATEYNKDDPDPVMATVNRFWQRIESTDTYFRVVVKALYDKVTEDWIGEDPFLDVDVSKVPPEFQRTYAEKLYFYNTKRYKVTYSKVYPIGASDLPVIQDIDVERVQYSGSVHDGIIEVTVEEIT